MVRDPFFQLAAQSILRQDDTSTPALTPTEPVERNYYIAKSNDEWRYTLGPLYVPDFIDAHGELTDADNMEKGTWNYVRSGNRVINYEHTSRRVGEWVGLLTWPFPVEVDLSAPGMLIKHKKVKFPAGTPFMGVHWDEWAWQDLVKPGKILGFSMEGLSTRVRVEE